MGHLSEPPTWAEGCKVQARHIPKLIAHSLLSPSILLSIHPSIYRGYLSIHPSIYSSHLSLSYLYISYVSIFSSYSHCWDAAENYTSLWRLLFIAYFWINSYWQCDTFFECPWHSCEAALVYFPDALGFDTQNTFLCFVQTVLCRVGLIKCTCVSDFTGWLHTSARPATLVPNTDVIILYLTNPFQIACHFVFSVPLDTHTYTHLLKWCSVLSFPLT